MQRVFYYYLNGFGFLLLISVYIQSEYTDIFRNLCDSHFFNDSIS